MSDEIPNTPRATRRPAHIVAPAHWQRDGGPPMPAEVPSTPREEKTPHGEKEKPDPVRYGDWERNGIAVDF